MEELVQKLVADFPHNPAVMSRTLRRLSEENWPEFLSASLSFLSDSTESHGARYLMSLLLREKALQSVLCDPAVLSISQASAIARLALVVDPGFAVDFAKRLTSLEEIHEREAEWILKILEEVWDSTQIRPSLIPLLRHPSPRIRSKAALLIGRANRNPELAAEQVSDEDARVRANAIEALWGVDDPACAALFYNAARDPHQRVAGNAIVGLYKLHHVSSIRLLHELVERPSLAWQTTAVWAMGMTGNPRFQPLLTRLLHAGSPHLRLQTLRALTRLRQTIHTSKLAGALSPCLFPDAKCSTNLIATVGAGTEPHVPNLAPTDFLLRSGEEWIQDYSVVERSAPPVIALGLLLPGSADPALLANLTRKRPADQWCVRYYNSEASQEPRPITPAPIQSAIQFTRDTEALSNSVADCAAGSMPLPGLARTFNAMVEALLVTPASRHLICVSCASSVLVPFEDIEAAADRARRAKVAIHAIVPADGAGAEVTAGFFDALCNDTGGSIYTFSGPDEIPAMLQRIRVSLLDHYEISFTRTIPEAQDLTVQICSPQGYGEASLDPRRTADPMSAIGPQAADPEHTTAPRPDTNQAS